MKNHLELLRLSQVGTYETVLIDDKIKSLYQKVYKLGAQSIHMHKMLQASYYTLADKEMAMRRNLENDILLLQLYQSRLQAIDEKSAGNDLYHDLRLRRADAIGKMVSPKNKNPITLKQHKVAPVISQELKRIKGELRSINYCYGTILQHILLDEVHEILRQTNKKYNRLPENDTVSHELNNARAQFAYQAARYIIDGHCMKAIEALDSAWALQ